MKHFHKHGFTIIETILFLGISGSLIAGVLIGTGSSINTQRYRDSVVSLRSFLQQQYSDVSNVRNSSAINNTCGGISGYRGQTKCVILGRYVIVQNPTLSSILVVKNVIGIIPDQPIPPNPPLPTDDVGLINKYRIEVSTAMVTDDDTYNLEWDASMKNVVTNHNPMEFSMLILRSPTSGIIRTFIDADAIIPDADIGTLVTAPALKTDVTICVDSNGLFTGPPMAVLVNKNVTSASGIEMLGETSGC